MDYSTPGYSVHGIFMASILELVAKPSSRGSSRSRDQTHISCIAGRFFITEPLGKPMSSLARLLSHFTHVRLFVILWTVIHQAPLSHRILQARILEQVALPSSRRSSPPRDGNCVSLLCPLLWQASSLPIAPPGKPFHLLSYLQKTSYVRAGRGILFRTFFSILIFFKVLQLL